MLLKADKWRVQIVVMSKNVGPWNPHNNVHFSSLYSGHHVSNEFMPNFCLSGSRYGSESLEYETIHVTLFACY